MNIRGCQIMENKKIYFLSMIIPVNYLISLYINQKVTYLEEKFVLIFCLCIFFLLLIIFKIKLIEIIILFLNFIIYFEINGIIRLLIIIFIIILSFILKQKNIFCFLYYMQFHFL